MGSPVILSVVARSGTGKTTFLERLIPSLLECGLRVMVIKHDVHGFEVDRPGKDSWRLRQAGAVRVLIANAQQMALMGTVDGEQPLRSYVQRYAGDVDLVLTEGYRRSGVPKILVARSGSPEPFDPGAPEAGEAIAAVTDHPLDLDPGIPQLPLDDPAPLVKLLLREFLPRASLSRELTGVLLAGGASRRMGRDKAWLEFGGQLLLPRLAGQILPLCSGGVIVVRRSPDQALPELPDGVRVADDLLPEHAALGGLYTGLALAPTPHVFLAGCDMPLLSTDLVGWLAGQAPARADVLLPVSEGRPQPVHAIYSHHCLAAIKEALLSGEFRMDGWHGSVRVERIEEERWRSVHPSGDSFRNANSPEELAVCEALAAAQSSPGNRSQGKI
ncbi:MAG: molybdopterin-guanine dinucleotide biosynthesis protein B [Myxococcota bacterium]|nr:molybdopterin-guanine dinucleotide biosynthesis protein B [Myxococcota bacterium]